MQRGIVVDIQSKHLVVMTADGLFKKIPKQNSEIELGEEVSFSVAETPRRVNWKVYISGAVAAVLAIFFLFPFFFEDPVYAHTHLYVEIEPGIEFGLNKQLEVVQVRPIDPEAKELMSKLDWNEQPAKKVVVDYLKQARMRGYLKKNDKIVLSAINEKGSSSASTLQSIQKVIDNDPKIGRKEMDLEVYTFSMPKEIKQKAERTGLTPGKYGVWLLSKKEGKEIPVEQVAESPISDLTHDIKSLESPPTESEWIEIATEEEQGSKETDPKPEPTQTNPKTNIFKKRTKPSTDPSSEQADEQPPARENRDHHPPFRNEDKKSDEKPNPTKDQGGEEKNSTSTGDSDQKTNHAFP